MRSMRRLTFLVCLAVALLPLAFSAEEQPVKAESVEVPTVLVRPEALAQAEKQIRSGQPREAEADLRGWLAANADSPYTAEAEYLLGQSRFAQKDYAGAKFFHEKVLDRKKLDRTLKALALFARADCNYEMGSYHTASRQYHWLEELYRDVRAVPHDELLFKIGMSTRKAGFEATSNYWFNKVVELYATTPYGERAREMNTKLNGAQDGKPTYYALEVGKYNSEEKALADADELRKKGYANVDVEEVDKEPNHYYRLTVGRFFNRNEALRAQEDADMAGLATSVHPGLLTTSK